MKPTPVASKIWQRSRTNPRLNQRKLLKSKHRPLRRVLLIVMISSVPFKRNTMSNYNVWRGASLRLQARKSVVVKGAAPFQTAQIYIGCAPNALLPLGWATIDFRISSMKWFVVTLTDSAQQKWGFAFSVHFSCRSCDLPAGLSWTVGSAPLREELCIEKFGSNTLRR